jgi:hypothetical protein
VTTPLNLLEDVDESETIGSTNKDKILFKIDNTTSKELDIAPRTLLSAHPIFPSSPPSNPVNVRGTTSVLDQVKTGSKDAPSNFPERHLSPQYRCSVRTKTKSKEEIKEDLNDNDFQDDEFFVVKTTIGYARFPKLRENFTLETK